MTFLSDWGEFIAAFIVFFLSHTLPVRPPVKQRIVARVGALGFTLGYSALSIAILVWIISAAGRAPFIELWQWQPWQNHVPITGMLPATVLVTMAIGRPNPLSFGGWGHDRFDPENPGLIGWVHHPLLVALLIWSLAHLVPNGDLAHVIVFGLFAAFSLLGIWIINRRAQRILGRAEWQRLANTKRRLTITAGGMIRVLLGIAIYLALLYSHVWFIGVSPFVN